MPETCSLAPVLYVTLRHDHILGGTTNGPLIRPGRATGVTAKRHVDAWLWRNTCESQESVGAMSLDVGQVLTVCLGRQTIQTLSLLPSKNRMAGVRSLVKLTANRRAQEVHLELSYSAWSSDAETRICRVIARRPRGGPRNYHSGSSGRQDTAPITLTFD